MVSLTIGLISILNTQLVRCYNILALQHKLFDTHGTPVSEKGVLVVDPPITVSLDIGAPRINVFCREVSLSYEVKTKVLIILVLQK